MEKKRGHRRSLSSSASLEKFEPFSHRDEQKEDRILQESKRKAKDQQPQFQPKEKSSFSPFSSLLSSFSLSPRSFSISPPTSFSFSSRSPRPLISSSPGAIPEKAPSPLSPSSSLLSSSFFSSSSSSSCISSPPGGSLAPSPASPFTRTRKLNCVVRTLGGGEGKEGKEKKEKKEKEEEKKEKGEKKEEKEEKKEEKEEKKELSPELMTREQQRQALIEQKRKNFEKRREVRRIRNATSPPISTLPPPSLVSAPISPEVYRASRARTRTNSVYEIYGNLQVDKQNYGEISMAAVESLKIDQAPPQVVHRREYVVRRPSLIVLPSQINPSYSTPLPYTFPYPPPNASSPPPEPSSPTSSSPPSSTPFNYSSFPFSSSVPPTPSSPTSTTPSPTSAALSTTSPSPPPLSTPLPPSTSPASPTPDSDSLYESFQMGPSPPSSPPPAPPVLSEVPFWYNNDADYTFKHHKHPKLNVLILVIGSRGDIQPFIVLALGLIEAGHSVRFGTHATFREFVEKFSSKIEFVDIGGNPQKMMEFIVKYPSMITMDYKMIRGQQEIMAEIFDGCWDAATKPQRDGMPYKPNVLVCNPPTLVHIHLAEKLAIPLQIWFTMPWTPTDYYKHPFAWMGSSLYSDRNSYHVVDVISCSGNIVSLNNWREKKLGLPPIWRAAGLQHSLRVPHIYCFSEMLVPRPPDWAGEVGICGFLFPPSDSAKNYEPPEDLSAFLKAGEPPVYIGFGSIVVEDPVRFTMTIIEAVKTSGVRCILSKGWMGLGDLTLPDSIYLIGQCPHDWLFPHCSAVVHHGGAGTTSTGLLHGRPTVIIPFFGDQPFWGEIVLAMGVGPAPIFNGDLTCEALSTAILECQKEEIIEAAKAMGEKLRSENSQKKAVELFHQFLPLNLKGELEWHLFECEKYEYGKWRPRNSRYSWGDPLGLISRKQEDITPGLGWEFSGNWKIQIQEGKTDFEGWRYSEGEGDDGKWFPVHKNIKMIFRQRIWTRAAKQTILSQKLHCRPPPMSRGLSFLGD